MKILTKVALVSAMAMQSMDDESLSAATGQDGVTISLLGNVSMDYLAIVDADGVGSGNHGVTTSGIGAIVVGNTTTGLTLTPGSGGINLIIDADDNAGAPVLNINAALGNTVVGVGSIGVASSNATGSSLTNRVDVLDVGNLTLNGLTANIQLGNQPQGALIKLNSTITGGLTLSDLSVKQGANHGIGLGSVNVRDNAGPNLTLGLDINATNNGLEISGITPMDISASSLRLGNLTGTGGTANAELGALYISNLNVGTSIAIRGH